MQGSLAVGLGGGATFMARSSIATGWVLLKRSAIKGFSWTNALLDVSMSCSEGP